MRQRIFRRALLTPYHDTCTIRLTSDLYVQPERSWQRPVVARRIDACAGGSGSPAEWITNDQEEIVAPPIECGSRVLVVPEDSDRALSSTD